jgi:hypothetical protein
MSIAVLLSGRFRGNEKMVSIHKENIGNYDTYVSCLKKYESDWKSSNWDIKDLFITPEINFKETKWAEFRDDGAGESGFWQFWNLKNLIDNVPIYDWYIKSRNDLLFHTKLDIDFNKLDKNKFYCPNSYFDGTNWNKQELLNDQIFIVSYDNLKIISQFVSDFYIHFSHQKNHSMASNERCLRNWLRNFSIEVEGFDLTYTKNHNGHTSPSGYYAFELE